MRIFILLVAFLLATSVFPQKIHAQEPLAGSSAALTQRITSSEEGVDIRVVALENTFKKHDSPLAPYARVYVEYADKYGVDWKLLPAISGLESSFGKFLMPGSYNAYGWGGGHIYFEDWKDGIETINKALKENYMDKWGAKDVWEIGPIYAESKTWSVRVNSFMNEINKEYVKLASEHLAINL